MVKQISRILRVPAMAVLVALLVPSLSFADDKLDDGLDDDDRTYPIFVRMNDQLLKQAGDYEKFCAAHQNDKRSVLRPKITKMLKDSAEASWKKIQADVEKLVKDEQIKNLDRYWIVNGFGCDATGKAAKQLAKHEAVSFVYLQRGPLKQHRKAPAPGAAEIAQRNKIYEDVLKEWKDDSKEELSIEGLEIPWNVKRVQADQAWTMEKTTGKGVTVATLDSGMMVAPALVRALWKNPKETLNGKDDDGNGYVDDLFGWDFQRRFFYSLGDSGRLPHGSMCAGIVAGRPINKKKMITGIAPRARVMPLRGMGYLKAYEYALENGADVISMSYMWVNVNLGNFRGVYRTAHEHLAAAGVVSVGGAGNFAQLGKGKQIALPKDIPCVIAAAGIVQNGKRANFSSQGPCFWENVKFYSDYPKGKPLSKPDVTGCIGGYPVWGRPLKVRANWQIVSKEGDAFALVIGPQGNSFSGPHAAGVAALMFSANPDLNAWEVKALMEKTCKDLGAEGHDPQYGAGLLQALEAVRAAKKVKK